MWICEVSLYTHVISQTMYLNIEVAYKKRGGYMFTENTEQDGRLIHLLIKKLNMFLGVYYVLDSTDLHIKIHITTSNTTQNNSYKFWGVLSRIRIRGF